MHTIVIAVVILLMMTGINGAQSTDFVNLAHLEFLTESVTINGEDMALVHIYSEYPEYEWVDAAGEGLSAVDDVARAAVVYLWQYERTGDESLLTLARECLNFVLYMQAEDGEFYNFVTDRDGTINRTGNTSFKSSGWWAMRGLWALGEGVRVFDGVDSDYADRLADAFERTQSVLEGTLNNYGEYHTAHGYQIPSWIPGGEPAVASIGLLGLAAYYEARPNETTADILTAIADGIAEYKVGDHDEYPFGMHPVRANAPGFHHTWGAQMPHALVMAGIALDRDDWVQSAAESADSFLLRQLVFERWRHIGVVPDRLNQIAYGTNMLVQAYAALYRATDNVRYARLAGLAASWYAGNNMAGVQMYDPETGRVLDGIDGPVEWRVNRNSGAESTIEGLMSLIAIADIPEAMALYDVSEVSKRPYHILQAEDARRVVGTPVYFSTDWTGEGYVSAGRYVGLGEGQRMRLEFTLDEAGEYYIYAAHARTATADNTFTVQRAASPPTMDAAADDWRDDVPVLASNTAQQFLRGAGVWQGEDVDSHKIRLMWDDDNLYVLAQVRDPQHEQPHTLRSVWQGDTLWLYMSAGENATQLSGKITLAQTPDGPQLWNWIDTGFVDGGALAWAEVEGGYTYEARIPWQVIGVEPAAGVTFGFEAGRGIGGNSFMDLTGRDPDVATNLLQLTLVDDTMNSAALASGRAALDVRVDREDTFTLEQRVSPDADHFWLDRVTDGALQLDAGEHTLTFGSSDPLEGTNPAMSKVDAFYIQPVVGRKQYRLPDGRTLTLEYDMRSGTSSLEFDA